MLVKVKWLLICLGVAVSAPSKGLRRSRTRPQSQRRPGVASAESIAPAANVAGEDNLEELPAGGLKEARARASPPCSGSYRPPADDARC